MFNGLAYSHKLVVPNHKYCKWNTHILFNYFISSKNAGFTAETSIAVTFPHVEISPGYLKTFLKIQIWDVFFVFLL